MPQFDPSVIGSIGDNVPDVAGSQAKALTLADMYDRNTMNKSAIAADKASQADMTYAKQVLQGKDLSKIEDQTSAVAAITKRSPKLGMDLMRGFQDQQKGKNELSEEQLKIYQARHEIMGSAVAPLKIKHDEMIASFKAQNPNAPPDQIEKQVDQAMRPDMFATIKQLRDAKLPDGSPVLSDSDLKFAAQGFQNGYNPGLVDQIAASSQNALKNLDQHRKDRAEDRQDKRLDLSAKDEHRKVLNDERMEAHRERQDANADKRTKVAEAKAEATKSGFAGKAGDLLGALAERGVSLPAGFRSKDQQLAVLGSLWARNPGATADEIAQKIESGQLAFGNSKTEGRAAAGVAGKVTYAEHELEQTIPLVREASAKLPRGSFIPFNKLKQMAEGEFSDPNLAEFKMYMTSLSNAYDMLAARGGTDADKRRENRHNFDVAASPEALEGVLRAVQAEAHASGKAADQSMHDAANRNNTTQISTTPTNTGGAAGSPPAPFSDPGKEARYQAWKAAHPNG